MKRKILNILIFGSLVGFLLLGFAFLERQDQNLKVTFFDVGQGDSILIRTPQKQNILIDGGPDSKVLEKLGKFLPFYDRKIDLMVLTHPHADHVAGLIKVLERYKVSKVLLSGALHTTDEYIRFLELIKDKKIPATIALSGQFIDLGGTQIEVLYPFESLEGQSFKDLNKSSVVLRMDFLETSFLFTGDMDAEIERDLAGNEFDTDVDVLKVAHQGSKTSTSGLFLENVTPNIAVIFVGKNNFGHPHQEVLERLEKAGAKTKRTDTNGDIQIISNGKNFWLSDE